MDLIPHTRHYTPWQTLYQQLLQEGYRVNINPDRNHIDAGVCNQSQCEACGHGGLLYFPMIRPEPWPGTINYRAFGVCPDCNTPHEF